MTSTRSHRAFASLLGALVALAALDARADGLDTPGLGVAPLGRSGAWVARADDPLAAFYNPAAMVRNASGVHVGSHLMFREHCFERLGGDGNPVSPGGNLLAAPGTVCADIPPFPNPQVAATVRLGRRWALGLAVVGPHKHGRANWPETLSYANKFGSVVPHPAPQRYLMLEDDATLVYPTLSAAFAVSSKLSLGAGFVWGLARFGFSNMAAAVASTEDNFTYDIKAKVSGFDGFIPGFIASALYSPTSKLDLAATFRYSDAIRASADLRAQANYYTNGGSINGTAIADPANITEVKDAGTFTFVIPMEARLALRYHHPRTGAWTPQPWAAPLVGAVRDPMSEDLFDVEADLTYSNNSAVDSIRIRLAEDRARFPDGIQINGTPGYVPANADADRRWRDIYGVRLGGEFVAIPDFLAVRAGGFFETSGVDAPYLSLDFQQSVKAGASVGATVRLAMVDVSVGYQHTFFGVLDNGGAGVVKGLSGDATADFRTKQVINGGRATSRLDEVALGATVHY